MILSSSIWKVYLIICALNGACEESRSDQEFINEEDCIMVATQVAPIIKNEMDNQYPDFQGIMSIGCVEIPITGKLVS